MGVSSQFDLTKQLITTYHYYGILLEIVSFRTSNSSESYLVIAIFLKVIASQ